MEEIGVKFNEEECLKDPQVLKMIQGSGHEYVNQMLDEEEDSNPEALENLWRDTEAVRANKDNIFRDERELLIQFIKSNPQGVEKLKNYHLKRKEKLKKLEFIETKGPNDEKQEIEEIQTKSLLK